MTSAEGGKIKQPRHHRRNPQASGPAMGSQRPTGLYVAVVAPINPQELLPAVHGKASQHDAYKAFDTHS
jgi:hypothetical protein